MSPRAPSRPSSAAPARVRRPSMPAVAGWASLPAAVLPAVVLLSSRAQAQDADPPIVPKPAAPLVLTPRPAKVLSADTLEEPGYVPGYRAYSGLGMSPYTPQVPGLPGGFTPGFAAPMPTDDWT